ncbi:DUF7662 domain-containing protein [Cellulomonas fulva]|uniref:DUF7662 domain-containing protein n=1 Tax=Cellulomonas fulva TaxID=2835530 RepID=UPI003FD7A5AF
MVEVRMSVSSYTAGTPSRTVTLTSRTVATVARTAIAAAGESASPRWQGVGMAKYDPLRVELEGAAARGQTSLEMTFEQVGQLVGGLPESASQFRQWWANDSKVEARAWRAAGWHVAWVSLDHRRVRFETGVVGGAYATRRGWA